MKASVQVYVFTNNKNLGKKKAVGNTARGCTQNPVLVFIELGWRWIANQEMSKSMQMGNPKACSQRPQRDQDDFAFLDNWKTARTAKHCARRVATV